MGLDMTLCEIDEYIIHPSCEDIFSPHYGLELIGPKIGNEIFYWRKAYQIHNYLTYLNMVEEWDEDRDYEDTEQDWGSGYGAFYELSLGQLENLLDRCREVLEDNEKSYKLLPDCKDCEGEIYHDDRYYEQLEDTVRKLPGILNNYTSEKRFVYKAN